MFKKFLIPALLTIIILLNLGLGLSRIGKYSAVDEPYWTYGRISKFWTAVSTQKWKATNVNDKPGITVAILSGTGLLKYDPMAYKSLRGDVKTDQQISNINGINFYFRLPIFLFCTFSLLLFYFFLKKLLGQTVAITGFMLIGLSPIILGISMIINPDSLLWIFLPLSLLSYFIFQKQQNKRYLFITGIFFGLALLTKYVANILYIFFFLLPFLDYIFSNEKPELTPYLKKSFLNYLLIVLASMATFFLLYPAAWVNSDILLKGTFLSKAFKTTWPLFAGTIAIIALDIFLLKNKLTSFILDFFAKHKTLLVQFFTVIFLLLTAFVIADTYFGMKPFDLEGIISSPKGIGQGNIIQRYLGAIFADTYSMIFGISPIALLSLLFALALNLKKKQSYSEGAKVVFYFSIFVLFYYLASSVNNVIATVRYQIVLYPLVLIMSAIGLEKILAIKNFKKYLPQPAALVATFAILLVSVISIRPFYFAYASSLLPNNYLLNLKDMGDGSYEAANYLNSKPNARNLTIWSDKGAVCAVFVGNCIIGFKSKDVKTAHFDYFITSSGRQSRTLKLSKGANDFIDFAKAYKTTDYEQKIAIGNRVENYVKIVSANKVYKQEKSN